MTNHLSKKLNQLHNCYTMTQKTYQDPVVHKRADASGHGPELQQRYSSALLNKGDVKIIRSMQSRGIHAALYGLKWCREGKGLVRARNGGQ